MLQGDLMSIVGRNEIVREGLRRILTEQNFNVRTMSPNEATLMEEAAAGWAPKLIIVDSAAATDESLETCRLLRELFPESRIVLMGDDHGIEAVALAFAAGVDGYLIKAISCEPLVGALKLILMGEKVLPTPTVDAIVDPRGRPICGNRDAIRAGASLSEREIEILECLIRGDANKLISRRLAITEATVKVHVKAILRKLRVQNRTQAAIWAVNRGLEQPVGAVAAVVQH